MKEVNIHKIISSGNISPSTFPFSSWYGILFSLTAWSLCYACITQTFPQKSPEWCSRLVAFIHGFGSAITGLTECTYKEGEIFRNSNVPQTENEQFVLLVSLGYFLFDVFWCLYYRTESKVMLMHHVFSTVALYRLLWVNYAGQETCCGMGGMEVTNPLLQIRWFVRSTGFDKQWFLCVEVIFVLTFFIMRVGFGTYFFINVAFLHEYPREYVFYTTALYVISWLFVANIIQYIYSKYVKCSDKNRTSIHQD